MQSGCTASSTATRCPSGGGPQAYAAASASAAATGTGSGSSGRRSSSRRSRPSTRSSRDPCCGALVRRRPGARLAGGGPGGRPARGGAAGRPQPGRDLVFQLRHDILPTTRPALVARLQAALPGCRPSRSSALPGLPPGTRALGTDLNFAGPTRHFADRHAQRAVRLLLPVRRRRAPHRRDPRVRAPVPLGLVRPPPADPPWPATGDRRALGRRLKDHWTTFVRDQAPGPGWPAFTLPDRATTVLGPAGDTVETGAPRGRGLAGIDVMPRD